MDAAYGGTGILIGGRGNGAGVKNNDLSLCGGVGPRESVIQQLAFDGCSIGLGRAASEILHMIGRHSLIILSAKLRRSFPAMPHGCSITLTNIEDALITKRQPKAE